MRRYKFCLNLGVMMGLVKSEITVKADPVKTFRVAQEVEKYPQFMPDVEEIKVLERRDDGYSRVFWAAHAKVASIDKLVKWVEDEWWHEETLTSRFELVEGDYKHYFGDWTFENSGGGTKITLTVDYDLGLPLIGAMINKLLDRIVQKNLDSMLSAIKTRAEAG